MHHLIDLAATLLTVLSLEGPAADDVAKAPEEKERFEELDRNADGRIVLAEYVHGRKGATAEEFAAARDAAKQK
jgi:hypothetical protein